MAWSRPLLLGPLLLLVPLARAQEWSSWYALGPFEHPGGYADLQRSHPPEHALIDMRVGQRGINPEKSYSGADGAELRWRSVAGGSTALDVGAIRFAEVLAPTPGVANWTDNCAAYLYRKLSAEREQELRLHLGSDDGVRLWLNGELVFERGTGRGLDVHDEALVLDLREGTNHLFAKVVNGVGGWGFQLAPWRTVPSTAIDQSVQRGVDNLLGQQLLDGSWGYLPHLEPGPTAFRLYTLLKCGLRSDHPAVRRARAFVFSRHNDATYALSSLILALAEMNGEGDRRRVEELLDQLWLNQHEGGLFHYSIGGYNTHLPQDLSNTLFAALAMRAAAKIGVDVPTARWEALARGTLSCWQPHVGDPVTGTRALPRGFSYRPNRAVSCSMTVAGVSVLAIAEEGAGKRLGRRTRGPLQQRVRTGLEWLEGNFSWETNAGHPSGHHQLFNIYGIERVGGLLDLPVVAGRDWYWEGSRDLLQRQQPDGHWEEPAGHVETELALLFLKRATGSITGEGIPRKSVGWATGDPAAPVNLRASGDTPHTIWVESLDAELLETLEWSTEEGEGPRVTQVEYFARRDVPDARFERIAQRRFDGLSPPGDRRLPIQHSFPSNGGWVLRARIVCQRPPRLEGLQPEPLELLSADLGVEVRRALTEVHLGYAEDAARNRFRGVEIQASASSQIAGEEAHRAVDGNYGTRWHCALDDARPALRLSFPRSVRGRTLLLSHGWPRPRYSAAQRPLRGEVVLNGRTTLPLEMDPDPMTKTVVDLGRSQRIRTLEIRISEVLGGELGAGAFGFSEIELLR